jgi:WD40 repeat protein
MDVNTLAFKDSQVLASGSQDKTIKVWKFYKNTTPYKDIYIHSEVKSLCYSTNKKMLASGGNDEIIRIWDAHSFYCMANLEGHTGSVWSVVFSPKDDLLASASIDKTIKLWDLDQFSLIHSANIETSGDNDKVY